MMTENNNSDINTMINSKVDFNQLSSLQIGGLRQIERGSFCEHSASDKMLSAIYVLQDMGLVDELFNLTSDGSIALTLSDKLGGGSEKRRVIAAIGNDLTDLEIDYNSGGDDDYDTLEDVYRLGGYH
jgi:hypothetical protein